MSRPAVFLDRDGTIIEDKGFLGDPAGVALLPTAVDALRLGRRLPLERPWGEAARLSLAGHLALARRAAVPGRDVRRG